MLTSLNQRQASDDLDRLHADADHALDQIQDVEGRQGLVKNFCADSKLAHFLAIFLTNPCRPSDCSCRCLVCGAPLPGIFRVALLHGVVRPCVSARPPGADTAANNASRAHPAQCATHARQFRARFPSLSIQCAGYPGRLARAGVAPADAGAAVAAAGGGADSAGGDAALAAVHVGGRARCCGESGISHARRIRCACAGAQPRRGRRRPGHGHHAVAVVCDPCNRT